jgi:hypothetical protein
MHVCYKVSKCKWSFHSACDQQLLATCTRNININVVIQEIETIH